MRDVPCRDHTGGAAPAVRRFLVSQARGGIEELAVARQLSAQLQTRLTPWASVAAELTGGSSAGDANSGSGDGEAGGGGENQVLPSAAGRAFCFLPLPVSTGLPVAVNGYFELSSNRRDVWAGGDMAGAGAARAAWNTALLADGVAPAYLRLLLAAAEQLGPCPALWRLFPAGDAGAPEPWGGVARALYAQMSGAPLLWCPAPAPKGAWLPPERAALLDAPTLADTRLRALVLATGVPLVVGPGPGARGALLRHTPGAKQVGRVGGDRRRVLPLSQPARAKAPGPLPASRPWMGYVCLRSCGTRSR